ncbi:hypothetical protein BTVI_110342 [Pitangus sulphuratus]|nr:hypothetical protein BTVI_110342 [Pitangus sulphuratus]
MRAMNSKALGMQQGKEIAKGRLTATETRSWESVLMAKLVIVVWGYSPFAEEKSDTVALVGTWCPAKGHPPHHRETTVGVDGQGVLAHWVVINANTCLDSFGLCRFEVSINDNAQAEFGATGCSKSHFNSVASMLSALVPPQISSLIPGSSVPSDPCQYMRKYRARTLKALKPLKCLMLNSVAFDQLFGSPAEHALSFAIQGLAAASFYPTDVDHTSKQALEGAQVSEKKGKGGYMPYLGLVVPAFFSTVFDCCQLLSQGQDTSKAIEIQLQPAVHGYTAPKCGKNVKISAGHQSFCTSSGTEIIDRDEPKGGKPELEVILAAQLKCICTNAHNMQVLEAIVQKESYDVVAITETWWDDSHDWSAAMDGYKLFRRDRRDGRGGPICWKVS